MAATRKSQWNANTQQGWMDANTSSSQQKLFSRHFWPHPGRAPAVSCGIRTLNCRSTTWVFSQSSQNPRTTVSRRFRNDCVRLQFFGSQLLLPSLNDWTLFLAKHSKKLQSWLTTKPPLAGLSSVKKKISIFLISLWKNNNSSNDNLRKAED